ncbi:MAG TPA: hypothetical protein VFI78_07810 [Salinimicrobium sp.]|nr:hypothetical protein [Salinimicrobium sp.]
MKTVLVFKTSVSQTKEIKELQQSLDRLVNSHGKWNFDLEDCDNILRVENQELEASVKLSQTLRKIQCVFCGSPSLKNNSVAKAMQLFFA